MRIATWVLIAGVMAAGAAMQEEDDCIEDALALAVHGSAWPTEEEEEPNARQDARKRIDRDIGDPGDTSSEEDTSADPPSATNTSIKTETEASKSQEQTNTPAETETTKNPEQTNTLAETEASKNPEQTSKNQEQTINIQDQTSTQQTSKHQEQTNTPAETETTKDPEQTSKNQDQTSTQQTSKHQERTSTQQTSKSQEQTNKNQERTSTQQTNKSQEQAGKSQEQTSKNQEQTSKNQDQTSTQQISTQQTSTPIEAPTKPRPEKIPTVSNQTVETLGGLEILGPVQVLVPEMELGVPSATNETVYTPFESVHIVIPAGAWVARADRGLAPLTLTIFVLPPGTGSPRTPCGAAFDLGPRDQRLALPISISLPCNTPARAEVFRLNTTSGGWEPGTPMAAQQEGAVGGGTQSLGVHSALAMPWGEPQVTIGSSGSTQVGIAVGASFGALGLTACVLGAVFTARRKHARGENPARVSPSVGTELCFAAEV